MNCGWTDEDCVDDLQDDRKSFISIGVAHWLLD